jgi:hypothetical protein
MPVKWLEADEKVSHQTFAWWNLIEQGGISMLSISP